MNDQNKNKNKSKTRYRQKYSRSKSTKKYNTFFCQREKKTQWLRDRMMMMMVEKRILQSKLNC